MPSTNTYPHLPFLFLFLFLAGCCGKNDLHLASDLKPAWIPYQPHQNLTFIGEKGDTLNFLTEVRTYYQENTDQVCGPYHIQTEEVTFITPMDPDLRLVVSLSHEIVLNLKAFRTDSKVTGLEAKFNTVSDLYISHDWRDDYAEEKNINGQNFFRVLQVFGNPTPGALSFSEILYAQDKGLVGIKTFAGGWYYPN